MESITSPQLALAAQEAVTIRLLGGFHISVDDRQGNGFHHARLQDLLAYLLLQRGRPVPRQQLAFLFWPTSTERQARANLRSLWHRLRHTLPQVEPFIAADEAAMCCAPR